MATVRGCNIPDDLYYIVDKHVWARPEGDVIVVGLTDVAQSLAKTIISVSLKPAGKTVKAGRSLATVESGKWVGPVPSPVEGEVVEVNTALSSSPHKLNDDPYGEGWVAKIKAADWGKDSGSLVTGSDGVAKYQEFLEEQGITCEGE
jgi:glycine cleavage system H protein